MRRKNLSFVKPGYRGLALPFLLLGMVVLPLMAETVLIDDVEADGIYNASIAVESDGTPNIIYGIQGGVEDNFLKYATIKNGVPEVSVIDSSYAYGGNYRKCSISLDQDGRPCVAYTIYKTLYTTPLIYAVYDGSEWVKDTVDSDIDGCVTLRFDGDIPYILTTRHPEAGVYFILLYKKEGEEWRADSFEVQGLDITNDGPVDMVIKDGILHVFYIKDDTTDHPSGDYRIFTRTWDGSWSSEERLVALDRQYRYIDANISKDKTIGLACRSGYGGTGTYFNSYIYNKGGSWEQEHLDGDEDVGNGYMFYPQITYDTLNTPHIFGIGSNDSLWHYYKTKTSWNKELIATNAYRSTYIDCEIDNSNVYHLIYVDETTTPGHAKLYYTTAPVGMGIEEKKEIYKPSLIYVKKHGKLLLKGYPDTEFTVMDITGRKMDRIEVRDGKGEWAPPAEGVYFLISEKERYRIEVIAW